MADNVTADPGAGGAVFATDEIASVHYPRSKVVFGVDGVATDVSSGDPLPVTAASLPLPSGAATAANQTTGNTSLATIAGAVSGTEMQVDVLTMPTVAVTNAGLTALNGAIAGTEVQVDVLTMPTTTVQATNLDIRDLTSASDSVAVHGDVGVLDQLDLTNSNPAVVAIVDANGDQITSFGGGTQYTEDAAAAANPVGTSTILVRQDTPAALVTTDGDNVALRGTNYGAAYAQIVTSAGAFVDSFGGGTQYTEGDTDATITGTAMMMEVAANALQPVQGTVADGLLVNLGANNDVTVTGSVDATNAAFDVVGGGVEAAALRVTLASDSTGVLSVDDNGSSLTVDGTVAATQSGTWTLGANSGVDIGDVTINNASGASAVNIQDGGNSITVDGTVAVSGTVVVDTELPTAAAITDNFANPTTSSVMGMNMLWDGATWDRAPGNSTDGTLVNLGANNDVTVTGTVAVTQSGTWTVQPGNTANTTAWLVSDRPATSGGLSKFHLVGAATTNATNVKASAGQVYGITAFNLNAAPAYLKFHNTSGTPTAGSGVTDTFMIPGNTAGAGLVINFDKGIAFSTGIGITLVTGIADSNASAIAASEVVVNIYYA